jgi:hypothetical protein
MDCKGRAKRIKKQESLVNIAFKKIITALFIKADFPIVNSAPLVVY